MANIESNETVYYPFALRSYGQSDFVRSIRLFYNALHVKDDER